MVRQLNTRTKEYMASKKEFMKSPEMRLSRIFIWISLGILYVSLFSGIFLWQAIGHLDWEMEWPSLFYIFLRTFGFPVFWGIVFIRVLFSSLAVYVYLICLFGMVLIVQCTYSRACSMVLLVINVFWGIWTCLGLKMVSVLIVPFTMIFLTIVLFRIHIKWKRYEKVQMEEKLSQHTLLRGDGI